MKASSEALTTTVRSVLRNSDFGGICRPRNPRHVRGFFFVSGATAPFDVTIEARHARAAETVFAQALRFDELVEAMCGRASSQGLPVGEVDKG